VGLITSFGVINGHALKNKNKQPNYYWKE